MASSFHGTPRQASWCWQGENSLSIWYLTWTNDLCEWYSQEIMKQLWVLYCWLGLGLWYAVWMCFADHSSYQVFCACGFCAIQKQLVPLISLWKVIEVWFLKVYLDGESWESQVTKMGNLYFPPYLSENVWLLQSSFSLNQQSLAKLVVRKNWLKLLEMTPLKQLHFDR